MKLEKTEILKFNTQIPEAISSSAKLLDYLSETTFPESLFLFNSSGKLPSRFLLERPIMGMPGIRLAKMAVDPKLIYSFRLVSAELILPIRELANHMGYKAQFPLTFSAYFAKSGSTGLLPPHFDTHDVTVFQIFGERIWEVDGKKIDLRPGDLLRIPMGVSHQVLETKSDSLHITIGHHIPSVHTFLRSFIEENREKQWMGNSVENTTQLSGELEKFILSKIQNK